MFEQCSIETEVNLSRLLWYSAIYLLGRSSPAEKCLKMGYPHIQPVMRRYHIKNCYYRHHYLLFTMLYLWNIWLKLPEVLLLDVFFQHFWPDQLLFLSVTRGEFHYSPIGMFIFTLILQAMRKTGSGRWKHVKSQRFVECAMWGPHDS